MFNLLLRNGAATRCLHTSAARNRQRGKDLQKLIRKRQSPFHKIRYYDEEDRTGQVAKYPEEIPTYPTENWGTTDKDLSWKWHRMGQFVLKYPDLYEQLRQMYYNEKNMWYHSLQGPLNFPETLDFYQYITRTMISNEKPNLTDDTEFSVDDLAAVSDQLQAIYLTRSNRNSRSIIPDVMDCIYRWLACKYDHLQNVQIDEGGDLETFVKRSGYEQLKECEDTDLTVLDEENCVKYRIRSRLAWQMRSRNPLNSFFPRESGIVSEDKVPRYNYHPSTFDLTPVDCHGISMMPQHRTFHSDEFLTNKAGYWTQCAFWEGDPCEFGTIGVLEVSVPEFMDNLKNIEADAAQAILEKHYLAEGILAAFTWTSAQAYNQGFTFYNDITYPFQGQLVITDGRNFRFLMYQLNSLAGLIRASDCGLPVNMVWASEPMSLYESRSDDGKFIGWNDDVIRRIVDCIKLKPREVEDSSVLRPHLSGTAPRDVEKFMNLVGEPRMEIRKPLRIFTQGRPHPNEIFYLKPTTKNEILTDLRHEFPNIATLPGKYQEIADEYRRAQKIFKGRRQKTEKGPTQWR